MKDQVFGNLMDWGNTLDTLNLLKDSATLDDHQEELIRLLRYDANWRLREAAVEAAATLQTPCIETVKQIVQLIKRDDLYYNVRIMASEALSKLVPVIMTNQADNKDLVHLIINEANHDVSALLSAPEPPIFHDALNITYEQIQKVVATA
ncbi:MAG: HEAT repeat domain-containing protein [Desulfotignum sp.]